MTDSATTCVGKCYNTWQDGPTFSVKYSPDTKSLDFNAKVRKGTFMGLAFAKMANLDAIVV